MFVRMLKLPQEVRDRYDVSSLQVAVHAAAPCPVDVKRAMIDWWGPVLQEYYSSTEGAGATFINSEQWLAHPGSVGQAAVGILHICDDEGVEQPVGSVGTVYFEQEERPFSYYNDPEKTKAAQHPLHENWTTMGDVGYVDEEAFLYLTDRKSFMIISGGVNIYPQEVEDALTLHPAVLDVAVIGVPDDVMGESVKAVVEAAEGYTAGPELAEELTTFLRERIAGYKVPRSIDFTQQLPRTPTGKLLKRKVREAYTGGASLDRGGRRHRVGPGMSTRGRCGWATSPATSATAAPRSTRSMAGDPVDVLIGDYLAEVTLAALSFRHRRRPRPRLRRVRPGPAAAAPGRASPSAAPRS